jgi:hypothetical protein
MEEEAPAQPAEEPDFRGRRLFHELSPSPLHFEFSGSGLNWPEPAKPEFPLDKVAQPSLRHISKAGHLSVHRSKPLVPE